MRKKKIMLFLSSLCLLLTSCSQHDEVEDNTAAQPMSWAEEVSKMVTDFNSTSYSRNQDDSPIEIVEIRRQNYYVDSDTIYPVGKEEVVDNTSSTRGLEYEKPTLRVGTVKYIKNGEYGFSMVVNEPKLQMLYVNIEKGEVQDTARIPGLRLYMKNIPNFIKDQMNRIDQGLSPFVGAGNLSGSGGAPTIQPYLIPNIVTTRWGQGEPFNRHAPICTFNCIDCADGHMPAGCATIATAQLIAHCGKFKGTFYGNKDIPFSSIVRFASPIDENHKKTLASFCHEIALNIQMKFRHGASETNIESVGDYLKELGYTCELGSDKLDIEKIKKNLKNGIPHIVRGISDDGLGHQWLITGMRYDSKAVYYYCNWGQNGNSNGEIMGNYYTYEGSDKTYLFRKRHKHLYVSAF